MILLVTSIRDVEQRATLLHSLGTYMWVVGVGGGGGACIQPEAKIK
jgi:hypothetical protein